MHRILAGGLAAALALAFGAAQAAGSSANTADRPDQTGIDNANGSKPAVVERAENSRPAQATKRVAKKGTHAMGAAGHKTAEGMRKTGKGIENRLPNKAGATDAGTSTGDVSTTQPQR